MTTHFKALYTTTSLFVLISSLSTATPEIKGVGLIKRMCNRIGSWARQEDPEWDTLIASFEEASDIQKSDQKYRSFQAQQILMQKVFQGLPSSREETPEDFDSSLPQCVKKKTVRKEESSEPLSLRTALKGLCHTAYKGARYALKHPFQALTLGLLAGRVTTAAALSSDVFQIGPVGSSYQSQAPIARFNETAFVVWAGNMSVKGRIYPSNDTAPTDVFDVNQRPAPTHVFPDIANVNGNAVVVWGGFVDGNEIDARVFSPNGTALTDDLTLYLNPSGYQLLPVVANVGGNAFVVWYGSQTGSHKTYYCMVSPIGIPITGVLPLNDNVNADQTYPAIAAAIDGNFLVSWRDNTNTYVRPFFSNGTAKSDEVRVNQNTTCWQNQAPIVSLPDGNFLVSWSGDANPHVRPFFSNGTALSDELGIGLNRTGGQSAASMASLPNGNVLAVWHGSLPGGDYWDVRVRLLSRDGTPLSDEFRISPAPTPFQRAPSIEIINGRAFVTWQENQQGEWRVCGRFIDLADFFTSTTSSTTITSSSTTTAGITATSNTPPFTRLTRVTSLTRSSITTSSLPFTPPVTGKEKPWKKILIGTGATAASLVALTAGAVLAKKYRSAKKDTSDSASSPEGTISSNSFPVNGISHENYGRTAVVDVPVVNDGASETPYGFTSNVRLNDSTIYALTPNVRPDDSTIYALTPTRKTAVLDV